MSEQHNSPPGVADRAAPGKGTGLLGFRHSRVRLSSRHLGKLERALTSIIMNEDDQDPPFAIWISGEPGVGKTTLVDAAAREFVGDDWEFVSTQAFPHTGEILEPILSAVRQLLFRVRRRADDGDEQWVALWNHIVDRHAPALDRVLPEMDWGEEVTPYPDVDPEHERSRLIDHLSAIFVNIGENTPVVLRVEDAQHLDEPSRELLTTCARIVRTRRHAQRAELPLPAAPRLGLIVTTTDGREAPLELSEQEVLSIPLAGLGREEFGRLLADEYGEVPLSVREKVYQVSRGNPLDLQVRIARERQFRNGGASEGAKRLIDVKSFELEVASALRSLDNRSRVALRIFALMEKPISVSILTAVVAEDEASVERHVTDLARDGWLSKDVRGAYGLAHERLREPVLAELKSRDRVRWHRIIAEALQSEYEQRPSRRFQEVYYHFRNGPQDSDVVDAGFRAADEALRLYDFGQAIQIYHTLLEQPEQIEAERLEQGVATLADLVLDHGRPHPEILSFLERLLNEHSRRIPDKECAALWRRLGRVAGMHQENDKELAFYHRALKTIEGQEHSSERLMIFACIARVFLRMRQYEETLEYCRRGMQLSDLKRLEDDPEFLEICRVTEEAHFHRGELVEALRFEEQYLRLAQVKGSPKDVLESLLRIAYLRDSGGDADGACESLLEAVPIAKETGSRLLEAKIDERLGYLYSKHEQWDRSRRSFQRALEVHAEVGDEGHTVRIFGALGMLALFTGDPDDGASNFRLYAFYESMRSRSELPSAVPGFACDYGNRTERDEEIRGRENTVSRNAGGGSVALVDALSELGDLRRDCGELEVARATLRRGLRIAQADDLETARFYLQLGILYRMQGEVDAALDNLQDGLQGMADRVLRREWLSEYHLQFGLLAVAQGNYSRALGYLMRGLRSYLEVEHNTGITHALLHLADLFRRVGKTQAAEELALAGLTLADSIGVDRFEAEAWLLLGRIRSDAGGAGSGLQEIELAREILNRLGILEGRCRCLLVEARIYLGFDDFKRAQGLCGEALDIARDLGLTALMAESLVLRAQIEGSRRNRNGDFLAALQTIDTALDHIKEVGDKELELTARAAFAELYEERDREGVVQAEIAKLEGLVAELAAQCPRRYRDAYVLSLPAAKLIARYSCTDSDAELAG